MELSLSQVAGLKKANIEFNGLTVIAGENDTGKSTVGKIIFAVIKAIARYEEDLSVDKYNSVDELVEDLYIKIRKEGRVDIRMRSYFHPKSFMSELKPFIDVYAGDRRFVKQFDLFGNDATEEGIKNLFKKKRQILDAIIPNETVGREFFFADLDDIYEEIIKENDKMTSISKAMSRALVSEFYKQVTPKFNSEAISKIELIEGSNKLLEINIKRNRIEQLNLLDDILPFEDVTFIETPILMQMYDVVNQAETLFDTRAREGRPKIALHIKDLVSKLRTAPYFTEEESTTIEDIIKTVSGEFEFNGDESDFIFSRKLENNEFVKIKSTNTASGIKSFGMLQLLLQANILNKKGLLIIDEPETHLHPKWQVKYAELIVELVKKNIPVLITSHSPYMIQALKFFATKAELTNKLKFYLSNREGEWCEIVDVSDDLNKIFSKLAKPLQQLVWE